MTSVDTVPILPTTALAIAKIPVEHPRERPAFRPATLGTISSCCRLATRSSRLTAPGQPPGATTAVWSTPRPGFNPIPIIHPTTIVLYTTSIVFRSTLQAISMSLSAIHQVTARLKAPHGTPTTAMVTRLGRRTASTPRNIPASFSPQPFPPPIRTLHSASRISADGSPGMTSVKPGTTTPHPAPADCMLRSATLPTSTELSPVPISACWKS